MRVAAILDKQKRDKHLSILIKRLRRVWAAPIESRPVFVLGTQRSGTSMLMNVFHAHSDTEVFDEHAASKAFLDYRIKSLDALRYLIRQSTAPFVCFKPICDSHLVRQIAHEFPEGRLLWIYRDYGDNANSSLRKFKHATRAIRLVCTGQSGGGWFQEGVSEESAKILREVYSPAFSDFDLACLVWWARNRIVIEQDVKMLPNLIVMRYEDLATKPQEAFRQLFEFLGMRYDERTFRHVYRTSIRKHSWPALNLPVQQLCDDLKARLDSYTLGAARSRVTSDS